MTFLSRLRQTVFSFAACICLVTAFADASARGETAVQLLSGFDVDRIEAAYPPSDSKTFGELAKMVYRMNTISRKAVLGTVSRKAVLGTVTDDAESLRLGDGISVQGTIVSLRTLKVPESLVEFLEIEVFQDIVLKLDQVPKLDQGASETIHVIAGRLPREAGEGDRIEATGILIEEDTDEPAMVSTPLKWYPKTPTSPGWRLLSGAGVDVSELARVADRNKKPLTAEDNDAFYQLLAVSKDIGRSPAAAQAEPNWIEPIDLLTQPQEHTGDWVRMRLNIVRVTQVAVTDIQRQKEIGSDHYFQIDANGDLGGTVIRVPRPEASEGDDVGDPILFDGTYPVSLAMTELPGFLRDAIRQQEGADAVTAMISRPVQMEGFFFRLWSYSSDFMQRRGGGDQVGPLLIVAKMTDRRSVGPSGLGAEVFGYIAAIGIVGGLLLVMIWSRFVNREDKEVRQIRKDRESQRIELPRDTR
jgi:hypothetical protein